MIARNKAGQVVLAYHGTQNNLVGGIIENGFKVSQNQYDWLGDGVYFFQDAPVRAKFWGNSQYGSQSAVIGAKINLTGCMDLIDVSWSHFLADIYNELIEKFKTEKVPIPVQSNGAHRLDRAVLNYAINSLQDTGVVVKSIRGVFAEGDAIYPNSALFDKSHVQIAVRDVSVIEEVWTENIEKEFNND